MSRLLEFLKSVAGVLVLAGLAVLALAAVFVAWWIAVAALLALAVYFAVRGLVPRKPKGGESEVIEGEYRIERHDD